MRRIARRVRPVFRSARSRSRHARRPAATAPRRRRAAAGGVRPRVRATKALDHLVVLLREHRAGDIQQFTTRAEHLPKRVEDRRLARGEGRDVLRAAQPLHVGMAPRDARKPSTARRRGCGRTARRPTSRRAACSRLARRFAGEAEPLEIAREARAARRVGVERGQRDIRTSRGCAPVLPPGAAQASSTRCPRRRSRQAAARCAPASCTETSPASNPGSALDRHRALEQQRRRRRRVARRSLRRQAAPDTPRRWSRRRLTRRPIGGCVLPAASTASQLVRIARDAAASIHQRGCW